MKATPRASPGARIFLPVLLVLGVGLSACGGGEGPPAAPPEAATPITVQLNWTHQANFGGYYAAERNGEYASEGLNVTFIEGGPGIDWLGPVLEGDAQFGVGNAERLIEARADGDPVSAIGAVYRRSPAVFMAMADSGITRPEDFAGRIIEVGKGGRYRLHTLMARVGVAPDEYTVIELSPDLEALVAGKVDVRSVFVTNEVPEAERAGYEVNVIYPDDYGIQLYSNVIFTTEDVIARESDLVLRFLRATLRGWGYAVENPDAMGLMLLKYNPDADTAVETETMRASLPLIRTGEDYIGWMKAERWAGMEEILRDQGVLTAPLDVTEVYTMEFLEEIYGNGQ